MILNNTGMGAHVRSEWEDNVSMAEEGSQIIRVHLWWTCEAKTHLWIQRKDYVYYVLMVINVLTQNMRQHKKICTADPVSRYGIIPVHRILSKGVCAPKHYMWNMDEKQWMYSTPWHWQCVIILCITKHTFYLTDYSMHQCVLQLLYLFQHWSNE